MKCFGLYTIITSKYIKIGLAISSTKYWMPQDKIHLVEKHNGKNSYLS